ncbi:MAG: hypothetical protein EXR44_04415 [Dehalococcoidia bacterium]|nr:hypothetical protein [Dehalococcoidia bacterium]
MRIVDANIEDLNRSTKRGRVRSPETQQLISVIDGMTSGVAKAIMLGPGDNAKTFKARIAYAGRLAGKRLQVAVEADRVLFGLSDRPARKRRRGGKK